MRASSRWSWWPAGSPLRIHTPFSDAGTGRLGAGRNGGWRRPCRSRSIASIPTPWPGSGRRRSASRRWTAPHSWPSCSRPAPSARTPPAWSMAAASSPTCRPAVIPRDGPWLFFQRVPEGKVDQVRVHLDLHVGAQMAEVERLEALGPAACGSATTAAARAGRWPTWRTTSSLCRLMAGDPVRGQADAASPRSAAEGAPLSRRRRAAQPPKARPPRRGRASSPSGRRRSPAPGAHGRRRPRRRGRWAKAPPTEMRGTPMAAELADRRGPGDDEDVDRPVEPDRPLRRSSRWSPRARSAVGAGLLVRLEAGDGVGQVGAP